MTAPLTPYCKYYKTLFPPTYYLMSIDELDRVMDRQSSIHTARTKSTQDKDVLGWYKIRGIDIITDRILTEHKVYQAEKDDSNLTSPALGSRLGSSIMTTTHRRNIL